MSKHGKENSIRDIMADIDNKIEIIYRHQSVMADYSSLPRDYGTGHLMSENDAHILLYIFNEPGMTATRLGEITNRTKGTVSQSVGRLEKNGFVFREVNPDNKREFRLYVTETGDLFCQQHIAFDRERTVGLLAKMLQVCTPEEIDAFYKILRMRTELFSEFIEMEKQKLGDKTTQQI